MTIRTIASSLAALTIVGLGLTVASPKTEARIIKTYTHESGEKKFEGSTSKGKCLKENPSFDFVRNPVRAGRYALAHIIADCNARSELVAGDDFQTGKEYWVGWSMYFPKGYPKKTPKNKNRTIVFQQSIGGVWKLNKKDSQGLVFSCEGPRGKPHHNTSMRLNANGKDEVVLLTPKKKGSKTYLDCIKEPLALKRNDWNDIVIHFKATDKSDGFYQLWVNGRKVIDYEGPYLPKGRPMGNFKIGAYAGSPGSGEHLVFTDELKIGDRNSSYNEVAPKGSRSAEKTVNNPNLALGKPARSSSPTRPEHSARYAVDGKTDTHWAAQGYPQGIKISLGDKPKQVERVDLLPYGGDKGRVYQFKILADGKVVADRSNNTKGGRVVETRFKPTQAKEIEVVIVGCSKSCSSEEWGALKEVRVY